MQAYFVIDEQTKQHHDFNDVGSIRCFLVNQEKPDGKFYLLNFRYLEICYDAQSGNVELVNTEKKKWITDVFSPESFHSLLLPIIDAICYRSKLFLIQELYGLNDADICRLIEKNHSVKKDNGKIDMSRDDPNVDKTLLQIRSFVDHHNSIIYLVGFFTGHKNNIVEHTPAQLSIYQAFKSCNLYALGINAIKSGNDVAKIMGLVRGDKSLENTVGLRSGG